MRTALSAGVALIVLLGACAEHPAPSAAPSVKPSPSRLDGCVEPGDGVPAELRESEITTVTAIRLGSGARGVVLTPEHGGNICQWLPFGRELAAKGYQVLIWDPGLDPVAEIGHFAGVLRGAGATHVVLVGASNGANIATFGAAGVSPAVDGLAWLSGEDTLYIAGRSGRPVAEAAAQVAVPVLFIAAQDDPMHCADVAAQLAGVMPAKEKRVVVVPGTEHGVAMLSGVSKSIVLPALTDFLTVHTA
ncbi:alpha/beta fold hydrolase [Dactylosporangium darangshiense]|uniref:Alpha/beta hydrolase n=1 Tax=Dactylosporangium darangshiense TaxID=579108 RepID=A0ABP8DEK7_9ACTN